MSDKRIAIPAFDKPLGTFVSRDEVRRLLADYIASEGCSCCRNIDDHEAAAAALGKLLKVRKYKDGSGYDFYRYQTNKP